ncbi:hypothetical protein [uncultured Alteromonas sp.]|jgi:hypothetical protein|uniref:hypothetical protein n=1 Tax=uncultured Alteromonas sp. TaxID=179113 RepID=UPI0030D7C00F
MAKRYGKVPSKRASTITILWWRNMALQRGGNKKADEMITGFGLVAYSLLIKRTGKTR